MRKSKALAAMVTASAMALSLAGCAAQTGTQPEKQNETQSEKQNEVQSEVQNEAQSEVQPLWEAGSERNKIVVISDTHLGIVDE